MRETQAKARVCQSFQANPKFPVSTYTNNSSQNGEGILQTGGRAYAKGIIPRRSLRLTN